MAWRQNNIAAPNRTFHGKKGVSDVIALEPGGCGWFIEVKHLKNEDGPKTYQNQDQKDFEAEVTGVGHKYFVIRTIDDLIDELKSTKWGGKIS